MFMHTRGSAPKRFAKFGRQNELFVGKITRSNENLASACDGM